jgi:hypothetical protein
MKLNTILESSSKIDLLDYTDRKYANGPVKWIDALRPLHDQISRDVTNGLYDGIDAVRSIAGGFIAYNPDSLSVGGFVAILFSFGFRDIQVFNMGDKTATVRNMPHLAKTLSHLGEVSRKIGENHSELTDENDTTQYKKMVEYLKNDDEYQDALDASFAAIMDFARSLELPHFVMFGNKSVGAIRKLFDRYGIEDRAKHLIGNNKFYQQTVVEWDS